ncbi:MAG: VCBS repeat-containing protein, partial [Nitrospinae bacterium]|nr:VCBS repeat-containing protein [Nitrospinota bacterium]
MQKYLFPGVLLVALLAFPLACTKKTAPQPKVSKLFALTYNYSAGKEPSFLIAEDFDKDGNADLVVTNSSGNTFSFYKGNPDGSFNEQVVYNTGADPICVVAADFNRDGLPDLAELNYADQDIRVFLNTGRGGFRNAGHILKPGKIPINLAAGDFNEDGSPDLAVTLRFHKMAILFGKGNGNFSEPKDIPVLGQPTALVVGDYNNDKHTDIAVALAGTGNTGIEILWGKGNGEFEPSKRFKGGGQPL